MQSILATKAAPSTATPPTPQPRLVRAAHEFEAQMMKELMKPLNQGNSLTGADDDADDDSGSSGALGEFASEALGRALSEHGGFGIASSIVKQLSHSKDGASGTQNGTLPVTGSLHMNTVIKAAQ
jgi:Rod binding domain-containing protein